MKEIFVFGSNLAGRHGKGAALTAMKEHGAIYGKGSGLQGNSYAIPTKDYYLNVLPLDLWHYADSVHDVELPTIWKSIVNFLEFANQNQDMQFNLTKVGCGLAGYNWENDIFPMFCKIINRYGYKNTNIKYPYSAKLASLCLKGVPHAR